MKRHKKNNRTNSGKFRISWTFIIAFLLSFFAGNGYLFLLYTFSIILHELAHILMAKKLGYTLSKFELSMLGASMNLENEDFYGNDELLISIAGPFFSLLIFIISCCSWWIIPVLYVYTFDFAIVNLFIFVTNILPLYSLDGGRVLVCIIQKYKNRKIGIKIVKCIGVVFSLLLFILFLCSCFFTINFSIGIFSVFLFVSSTSSIGGYFKKISIQKKLNSLKNSQFLETKTFIFSDNARLIDLYRKLENQTYSAFLVMNKNGEFVSIDEIKLSILMEKYNVSTPIKDVLLV